jgi:DNA repair ATPase RecN
MSITIHPRNMFDDSIELNLSNANFRILSQLLHLELDEEDSGEINTEELEANIAEARKELLKNAKEWETSYSESTNEKETKIIEMPFRAHKFNYYFKRLETIIQVAKKHNVSINWA